MRSKNSEAEKYLNKIIKEVLTSKVVEASNEGLTFLMVSESSREFDISDFTCKIEICESRNN